MYARLDLLRAQAGEERDRTRRSRAGGSPQAQSERDAFDALWSGRVAQLNAVDEGLCFGRLDKVDDERLYLGRIGLTDADQHALLLDWRAPAAEAFYRATVGDSMGVARRRHLRTRGRQINGFDDEWLDLDAIPGEDQLTGEAALLSALSAARTGRMRDIVATLQAEQDRIVRADRSGVLVVQGGPGTGKTAVALHRAAYLLYTHRDQLASRGVLVVGPSAVFLRYVEQVLPALGETAVVLSTVAELYPGINAIGSEPDEVATVKGDRRMVEVIAAGVADRQRVPSRTLTLRHEGRQLRLSRRVADDGRRRARSSGRNHNPARNIFVRHVVTDLARQLMGAETWAAADRVDRDETLRDLVRNREIRATLDDLWPHLTPERFLAEFYADHSRIEHAGRHLGRHERELLFRPAGRPWTPADVPLLDEAAEIIGETDPWARHAAARAEARRRQDLRYAEDVLSSSAARGMIDASTLASRFEESGSRATVAEGAASDRTWGYGHVVVDEAQELSWMAWRSVFRRCPSKSMTVVGDTAQSASPWAATSWSAVLDEHAPDRWRVEELTVGYRTPEEVMELAADVLAEVDPSLTAPRAVRSGPPPQLVQAPDGRMLETAVETTVETWVALREGRLAVLTPTALVGPLTEALSVPLPGMVGESSGHPVAVLTVAQSKGLEFDAVVIVDPTAILRERPRGLSDLYVAVTRTTSRLVVVTGGMLPHVLGRLAGIDFPPDRLERRIPSERRTGRERRSLIDLVRVERGEPERRTPWRDRRVSRERRG
jgi:DNA helicase IV